MHLQVAITVTSIEVQIIDGYYFSHRLARLYTETKRFEDVLALLKGSNELFSVIPKAKTAKIVRNILGIVATIPNSLDIQVSLCKDVVEWCKLEKRSFLRQRIEAKVFRIFN